MHVSQICIYISNICKVHTCASYSTYVRFVPLGIYLCICDGMSEPSGPSGQRIGIHPPALKPGSILSQTSCTIRELYASGLHLPMQTGINKKSHDRSM